MKGTVLVCLKEVVVNAAGEHAWRRCLQMAGLDAFAIFTLSEDVPDETGLALVRAVCDTLNIDLADAADAFGSHWVGAYAPRIYKTLYGRYRNAREFFTDINNMHDRVVRHIADARPPRFELEWQDEKTLLMHYCSHRNLIDIAVGMARAMGRHFKEELVVTKLSEKTLRIDFASPGDVSAQRR